jgi:hypothetical protein
LSNEPQRSPSPSGSTKGRRHGRREHERPVPVERSLLERRRGLILGLVAVVAVVLVGGVVFAQATTKAYACSTLVDPAPTAAPLANGSPGPLGQVEQDMGRNHIATGQSQRYSYCPPASGNHYSGTGGPIVPRYYAPDDSTVPQGWIHNLEHGGLVVLYSCVHGGCDDATQQALKTLAETFPESPLCKIPKGTISPVITRFDDMKTPIAAVLWGRVLLQDKLDTAQILEFFKTEGELKNPEQQCARPSPTPEAAPGASPSAAPGASPATSPEPSPSPS